MLVKRSEVSGLRAFLTLTVAWLRGSSGSSSVPESESCGPGGRAMLL